MTYTRAEYQQLLNILDGNSYARNTQFRANVYVGGITLYRYGEDYGLNSDEYIQTHVLAYIRDRAKEALRVVGISLKGKPVKAWVTPNNIADLEDHIQSLQLMYELPLSDVPLYISTGDITKLVAKWRLSINK